MLKQINIASDFAISEQAVLYHGSCIDLLKKIPNKSIQLIVTSPPYNLGKEYEKKAKFVRRRKASVDDDKLGIYWHVHTACLRSANRTPDHEFQGYVLS